MIGLVCNSLPFFVIAFGQPAVIAIFTLLSRIWSICTGGTWSDPPAVPNWLAMTIPTDHYQRSTVLTTRLALKEQAMLLSHQRHPMADRFAEEVSTDTSIQPSRAYFEVMCVVCCCLL